MIELLLIVEMAKCLPVNHVEFKYFVLLRVICRQTGQSWILRVKWTHFLLENVTVYISDIPATYMVVCNRIKLKRDMIISVASAKKTAFVCRFNDNKCTLSTSINT